ncbi:Hypothetical predicted protein, partial [Podarcis lilfordi]
VEGKGQLDSIQTEKVDLDFRVSTQIYLGKESEKNYILKRPTEINECPLISKGKFV